MEQSSRHSQCPEGKVLAIMRTIQSDTQRGMRDLEAVLQEYSKDARLHFLKGSLLAGEQNYAAAQVCMRHAIELAPGYHLARFQLGLLLLTSGEAQAAKGVWDPLNSLPSGHYLHVFVQGLCYLIEDDFAEAKSFLEKGIALNTENSAMNADMQLIIENIRSKLDKDGQEKDHVSSVDFLLRQSALKPRR